MQWSMESMNYQIVNLTPGKLMAIAAYVLNHGCSIDPDTVSDTDTAEDVHARMVQAGKEYNVENELPCREGWTAEDGFFYHSTATGRYLFSIANDAAFVTVHAGNGKPVLELCLSKWKEQYMLSWSIDPLCDDRPDRLLLLADIFGENWPIALSWVYDAYDVYNRCYTQYAADVAALAKQAREAHLQANAAFLDDYQKELVQYHNYIKANLPENE